MAEQEQSRSEDATQYKLEQARKKGSVARGQDFTTFAVVTAGAVYLWSQGPALAGRWTRMTQKAIAQAPALSGQSADLFPWAQSVALEGLQSILPLLMVMAGAGVLSIVVQIGFLFAPESLKPDFQRISPMNVLKRLFSVQTLFELAKSSCKFALYVTCAFLIIREAASSVLATHLDVLQLVALLQRYGLRLAFGLVAAMAVFALIDLMFARWQYARQMKMSRREVREESRNREGDPKIKQQRKRFQLELLKKARSLRAVRTADVLVTNPTHFAVALRYDQKIMSAPMPVAKGSGNFALRLKRLALVYSVPVMENPGLARRLFFKIPLEQQIPPELYAEAAQLYLSVRRSRRTQPPH